MMALSQRALQTGLPSTCHVLHARGNYAIWSVQPLLARKVHSLAIQKGANTVADLLYLTFQSFLPSEPMARVEGLATIEAPVKPSRAFSEAQALQHFTYTYFITGSLRQRSRNGGQPDPSQIGIKTLCNDVCLLTTIDLLEVELASGAQEEEERRKQKNANVAVASFTSTGSAKTKLICRNFTTENGCNKRGQCTFLHPTIVSHCLRCDSAKHAVSECKRPRKDSAGTSSAKGKGKGKSPSLPKSSSSSTPVAKAKPKADAKKSLTLIQSYRERQSLRHLQHHPLLKQCIVSSGQKTRRRKQENRSPLQSFYLQLLCLVYMLLETTLHAPSTPLLLLRFTPWECLFFCWAILYRRLGSGQTFPRSGGD